MRELRRKISDFTFNVMVYFEKITMERQVTVMLMNGSKGILTKHFYSFIMNL